MKHHDKYDYQPIWIRNVLLALAEYGSCLGVLPTGGGKTVCFNEVIRRCALKGYRVLVLAHREELILQAQEKLWKSHKLIGGIIMSGYKSDYSLPVQIASIQTLIKRPMPKDIQVVIVDEAHHATAETYKTIIANYPNAKILGVTATPVRSSGEGFDHIFKSMVVGPSIKELEHRGALVPAKQVVYPIAKEKLSQIKVTAGDYNEKQLGLLFGTCEVSNEQVDRWERHAAGLSTIMFAINISHSQYLVAELRRRGHRAEHVDGGTDKDYRKAIFKRLENRQLDVVVNVGIATEGTDIPSLQCVALFRPTMSLSLYLQMAGRGARCFEGKKDYTLLDCANCIIAHGEPNQDREWSLKGDRKKKGQEPVKIFSVRFQDGTQRVMSSDTIPVNSGAVTLIEIKEPYRVDVFDQYLSMAVRSGRKPFSAYYRFVDQYKNPSRLELSYIAKRLDIQNVSWWVEEKFKKSAG